MENEPDDAGFDFVDGVNVGKREIVAKHKSALRAALAVVRSTYLVTGMRVAPTRESVEVLEAELRKIGMLEE